ncbi:hypothetical protein [Hymenobacter sp. DG25B]|uniref:hypothetical protein n=1 Tax=Hymenobacter sp. DG25B TaxID=1385664 RepID=UPI000A798F50|nr:hypothetical protein [Hymenobacter sp. DG25B]
MGAGAQGQQLSRDTVVSGPLQPGDEQVRETPEQVADGQPVTVAQVKPAGV